MILDAAPSASWTEVASAALNVFQTLALAYLAADRHSLNSMRKQGQLTRASDAPPSHPPRR